MGNVEKWLAVISVALFAMFAGEMISVYYFMLTVPEDAVVAQGFSPDPKLIQFVSIGVAPAGIDVANTGHHHLLINVDEIDYSLPIPSSNQHLHFGLGQTETKLVLPSGKHTLQLVLGGKYHIPNKPPLISKKIEVTVVK